MAYFPNATDAEYYQQQFCDNCKNQPHCKVMELHFLWANDQDELKKLKLESLIPTKDGNNLQCRLYTPTTRVKS